MTNKITVFVIIFSLGAAHADLPRPRRASRRLSCDQILSALGDQVWETDLAKAHPELLALQTKRPTNPTWTTWGEAMLKLAHIKEAASTAGEDQREYFERIVKITEAALTKHQLVFARERYLQPMKLTAHLHVLRAIRDFDPRKGKYGLYKIKAAVETTLSVPEYLRCQ